MSDMQYRRMGESGLMVSAVGLGCNNFGIIDADSTQAVVHTALDAGVTLFDTGPRYGLGPSEEYLGAALKGRRDDAIIATRPPREAHAPDWGPRGSRRYLVRAAESSLRRLDTDWIDLYLVGPPDPDTPMEETLSALDDLIQAGTVRYLGSSHFAAWQVADADRIARTGGLTRFVCTQDYYNLLRREAEAELVPACWRSRMGLVPFFPARERPAYRKVPSWYASA